MVVQSGKPKTVLVIGSAPDAPDAALWPKASFSHIVAINNAWAIRSDWDYLIHPEDFPVERLPLAKSPAQSIITAMDYVPVQNAFGGFVYAGGTMAFTAGYWALGALKPDVIAFFGCDMVYTGEYTHFYGTGAPDPLRKDITLQSLLAKSARLMLIAARHGCLTVNLSRQQESQLVFPRVDADALFDLTIDGQMRMVAPLKSRAEAEMAERARKRESELGYIAKSGRYWEMADSFDAEELRKLDALWLEAANPATMRQQGT